MAAQVARTAEPVSPASGFEDVSSRCVSVVVGCRRFDVVVDERLLVADLLALVSPSRPLAALTMTGVLLPLEKSLAQAGVRAGSMVLAVPRQADSSAVARDAGTPTRAVSRRAGPGGADAYRPVAMVCLAVAGALGVLALAAAAVGLALAGAAAIGLAAAALVSQVAPSLVLSLSQRQLVDGDLPAASRPAGVESSVRHADGVDPGDVARRVRAAVVAQTALLVALLVVTFGCAVLLGEQLWHSPSWSTGLFLTASGTTFALGARGYRRVVDRVTLLAGTTACAVAVGLPFLMAVTPTGGAVVGAAAVVGAVLLVVLARAVSQGRRSLWASRVADGCAVLAVVSTGPLALWSAGLVARAVHLLA